MRRKRLSKYIRPSSAKFNQLNARSHLTRVRSRQAHFFYFYQQTSPSWGAQVLARSMRNSLSTYFIPSPTKTAAAFQKTLFQQPSVSCKRRVSLNYLKTPRPQEYKIQLSTSRRHGPCPSTRWVTASNHHLSVNDTVDQTMTLPLCRWIRGDSGSSYDIWDFSPRFTPFLLAAEETETWRGSRWLEAAEGAALPVTPGSSSPRSPVFQLSRQSSKQAGPLALQRRCSGLEMSSQDPSRYGQSLNLTVLGRQWLSSGETGAQRLTKGHWPCLRGVALKAADTWRFLFCYQQAP